MMPFYIIVMENCVKRGSIFLCVSAIICVWYVFTYKKISLSSAYARIEQEKAPVRGDVAARNSELVMSANVAFQQRKPPPECTEDLQIKAAWVTSVGSAEYIVPLTVLAYTLDVFSCIKQRVAFTSSSLEQAEIDTIHKLGFETITVGTSAYPEYTCDRSRWSGTFYRFNAWRLVQYDKVIYIDADIMLLSNIDDLFEYSNNPTEIAAAYFAKPGMWRDTGFNAGLLVLTPSVNMATSIVDEWTRLRQTKPMCTWTDQPFLWHFFAKGGMNLTFLPYAYCSTLYCLPCANSTLQAGPPIKCGGHGFPLYMTGPS